MGVSPTYSTKDPEATPARCPRCANPAYYVASLRYPDSKGASDPEPCDYYSCQGCGLTFSKQTAGPVSL